MNRQEIINKIYQEADSASQSWFKRQSANLYAHMFLYYKPGQIVFWIGEDLPDDKWELAWNTRISIAKTIDAVRNQIIEIAQRLPILS